MSLLHKYLSILILLFSVWGFLPVEFTYAVSESAIDGAVTNNTPSPVTSQVIPANTSLGAAQQGKYTPLVNLPGLIDNDRTLGEYVNVLFRLAVGIAALIAMIKIIVAGIKYMASDAVFSKEEAKKDIQGALLGLLIILSTVVILAQINGNILNIDVLQNLQPLKQVERPVVPETPSHLDPRLYTQNPKKERLEEAIVVFYNDKQFGTKIAEFQSSCTAGGGQPVQGQETQCDPRNPMNCAAQQWGCVKQR